LANLQGSNTVGAYEAKTHLSKLLEKVEAGEEITITKHGSTCGQARACEKGSERRAARRRH
jgi:antitoxin (DNA-binding transcriptional repressor) of toxin-antitoxin stability system